MGHVTIRPYQEQDIEHVVGTLGRAMPHEGITIGRFASQTLADPNFRPECAMVAWDARPVGACIGIAPPGDTGYILLFGVEANERWQGIGTKLLAAVESAMKVRGVNKIKVSTYGPGYYAPGVGNEYKDGLEFLQRHGYSGCGRALSQRIELDRMLDPDPELEDRLKAKGVTIAPSNPDSIPEIIDFAQDNFGPDWASFAQRAAQAGEPQRLIAAWQNGMLLGFSHFEGERFGPIGVLPERQGEGIGRALCRRTLRAQKRAGLKLAWFLWSDDRTADRLYRPFGFEDWRRFTILEK